MSFKKISIYFAGILTALFLIGFLIPHDYKVERQATIIASPKMVFAFLGDLARWKEWTTWSKMDPSMEQEITTPSFGVGATQNWKSKKMGAGSAKVTDWIAEQMVGYDLQFEGMPGAHAEISLTIPAQGATVTWTMTGQVGTSSPQRWFGLILRFFLGRDLSKSLENLKTLCENSAAADIKAPWNKPAAHRN